MLLWYFETLRFKNMNMFLIFFSLSPIMLQIVLIRWVILTKNNILINPRRNKITRNERRIISFDY